MAWNIVIAGGGFGGLEAARKLERLLPRHSARLTLVSDQNFMLYTPLLPGAAAGTLEPRHAVVPLREQLRDTDVRLGSVSGADPQRKVLQMTTGDGRELELPYDQLIVAVGSVSRTLPIPGLAEHAVGMKTLPEAIALRNRLLQSLEVAEGIDDPAAREAWLTFVFVGAGYAGLEGLAELQDFATDLLDRYPRCRVQGVRFVLVEARDRVMPEIPESLASFATDELQARGIEIRTGTTIDAITESTATLAGGEVVPTRTVVWTAGVKPSPVVQRLGLPLHEQSGRIVVERTLRVPGVDGVWAIGDAAHVPDPRDLTKPAPPTAQHAIRQGRKVAQNVAGALSGSRPKDFRYKTLGVFVDLGRGKAVASTLGLRWSGVPAWFLARTYHLLSMPGLTRKIRLVADWTVGLFFGRDGSELGRLGHPGRLDTPDRIALERDAAAAERDVEPPAKT
ncbi:NADH dehydrogenase [Patulibacter medicamentivorans]|jgi:NADH dehydrogenase|uniref:NADH dehydrogenase n=1 Tax=Patulibacter medicamentivorans TaxID=1097667 RepID=H0EBH3_9ACTN|nr:NAD(P)/FAD-dependent oxidoreductase [Patulibacter medicamentivorans]EHN08954.1 NADH dehydrogenase [Patulibacter medicamentivorans]